MTEAGYVTTENGGGHYGLPTWTWFVDEASKLGYRTSRTVTAQASIAALEAIREISDRVIAEHRSLDDCSKHPALVVELGDAIARLVIADENVAHLSVIAQDVSEVQSVLHRIAMVVAAAESDTISEDEVAIRMWNHDRYRATSTPRIVRAPDVVELLQGLNRDAARAIRETIEVGPALGGVHVWHGPPGCGKTTAIRGLARAWSDTCTVEVILDPAHFLNDAKYMLEVLRATELDLTLASAITRRGPVRQRRVLVLEDAGEYAATTAPTRSGAGMSGLLNLTDGMFGDHDRPIVVMTTNEDIGKLHPAVTRPGRCRSVVEFQPLDPESARDWLAQRGGIGIEIDKPTSIARLASLIANTMPTGHTAPMPQLGFAV